MEQIETAAPAQPEPVEVTLTPTEQAVADKDYSAFERAERERLVAPKPETPVAAKPEPTPEPEKTPEPAKPVSNRQQKANDSIREAVSRATAEMQAEIARLRAQIAPPAPAQTPVAPTLDQTIARPDVSKPPLIEADFYAKFPDAGVGDYAEYRAAFRIAYERLRTVRDAEVSEAQKKRDERFTKAKTAIEAAAKDEGFIDSVLPVMQQLKTREQAMADRQRPTALNDFATEVVESEVAPKILAHLRDHPEEFDRIRALETRRQVTQYFGRLEAKFLDSPQAQPAPLKTTTSAPEPPVALGSRPATPADPIASAIKGGDYLAYEQAERQRLAGRR